MMPYLHCETPVVESVPLRECSGKRVFLKMECFQHAGSYKIRGIGRLCQEGVASGDRHLVASSGGNAGYAVAYAGRLLGAKVTVVVPEATPEVACQRIRGEGAEVIVHGEIWDDANDLALELAAEPGRRYVPPFDHPSIWSGHATLVEELTRQMEKPDAVVLSVGGGGLLSGVVEGLYSQGWGDVPVVGVETEGAASFGAAVRANRLVRLEKVNTIAATLGVRQVASQALEWSRKHPIYPHAVSDASAVRACLRFADDHRVLVEPACGASLSVIYQGTPLLDFAETVLVVVCGGTGVSRETLSYWERKLAS